MLIKNAYVFNEDSTFEEKDIYIRNQIMIDRTEYERIATDQQVLDASGLIAIPGLTDIHFHGCAGYDFCDGTKEALDAITDYEARNGITTVCPATMTLPEDMLSEICRNAAAYPYQLKPEGNTASENYTNSILCGINLEGPFLSKKKRGAQDDTYMRKADLGLFERLEEQSGHLIKMVDIAPEEEGAIDFIGQVKDRMVVSLAHTIADYDIAIQAFEAGASHVTHLFNAMPPLHHREPGVIGAAFDSPDCTVELVSDGIHLHPSIVRAAFQLFGDDRVILVSDSMMATGLPDGIYSLGGQEVKVNDKKAELTKDGSIAGSVTNLLSCMRNAVLSMGIPLESAVKAAAVNPAKKIGIFDSVGSITPGKLANIVLLDHDLQLKYVILNGYIIKKDRKFIYDNELSAFYKI